jgi:hypothetical protein
MSLYNRLVKLKKKLGKTALRFPNTDKEKITRKNYDRVTFILTRRYEYNIDDALDAYRRQDQIDEIADVQRRS